MAKSRMPVILGLAALLIGLVILFILGVSPERIARQVETPETPVGVNAPTKETKTVTLFFLREEDDLFVPETRTIPVAATVAQEAESLLTELINGSKNGLPSALPVETKVGQIFVTKEGVAYADFSKELSAAHPSGSEAEKATVFAIVNSLAYNFKTIKKVFILVDGEERETLNGHIALNRAFAPDFSLVAKD